MTKTIDVATLSPSIREFVERLKPLREAIELVAKGSVVARLVPPEELSESEKLRVLKQGWQLVQRARRRNSRLSERVIAVKVAEAVRSVQRPA